MKLDLFNQLKKSQQPGESQGVNPFGDTYQTERNQPFDKRLEGISPVAQEVEPEYDLTEMSMDLDNNSFNPSSDSNNDDDEEKKKQPLLAQ